MSNALIGLSPAVLVGLTQLGPQLAAIPTAHDDVSSMTMADLIECLPPAGEEYRWDHAAQTGQEDPASEEMARRLAEGTLTDEQWRRVLITTGSLRFHDRWPEDEEYAISMTVPRWLRIAQIRVHPRVEGMRSAKVGQLLSSMCGTFELIDARDARRGRRIGTLPTETREIVFDVEVERGRSWLAGPFEREAGDPGPSGILWKGTITRPVEVVQSWEEAVPTARGEELDAAVRDAVGAGFRTWGSRDSRVPFLVIEPDCDRFPVLATTALDIKVELLDGGRVVADSWLVASEADRLALLANSIRESRERFYGSTNLDVPSTVADTSAWSLRLTGTADHVSVLWHAKQHWAGTITIPWDEAMKHEATRTAHRGRGPEVSTPYRK